MLQWEHSAILLTFIKLPFVIKIFVLSIFEWLLKTGFTVVILVWASRSEEEDLKCFFLSIGLTGGHFVQQSGIS